MSSKLNRIDYIQVGLTASNTLKLVETISNNTNNSFKTTLVIGDQSGSIQCFSVRDTSEQIETHFKTLPGNNARISCVEVINNISGSPKILASFGSSVIRGYTKRGKQFFGLELNNLTEPIKHLKFKWPNEIFICGQFIYNHYIMKAEDGNEKSTSIQSKNFFASSAKITGILVIDDKARKKAVPIIACEDRLIRILKESQCLYEIETCGIPNCLLGLNSNNQLKTLNELFYFVYGTLDGKLALISINFDTANKTQIKVEHHWEIYAETGSRSPIHVLQCSNDFSKEMYVGRADGNVEIWTFTDTCDEDGTESIEYEKNPTLRYQYNCNESITSIAVCKDGALIICSTFSGLVFGLTRSVVINKSAQNRPPVSETSDPYSSNSDENYSSTIETLRNHCAELENRILVEKEKFNKINLQNMKKKTNQLSVLPFFSINDSFILQEDASYLLNIETEVAIDCVIIQSDITIDLLDCERNSAVISFNESASNQVIVIFRCQANTTRLEIKISSIEGQYGQLRVYIITRMTPKGCQVRNYTIKPLSLHKRCHKSRDEINLEKCSQLILKGQFSLNEAHSWIHLCLPETPERLISFNETNEKSASNSSNTLPTGVIEYCFMSTLTDTLLFVICNKGELIFISENITTISIVKDFITRIATKKSVRLDMSLNVIDDSIKQALIKLYPKLRRLLINKNKVKFLETINNLTLNDSELAKIMYDEFNLIDKNDDESNLTTTITMGNENKNYLNLDRLYGLITDLYIDYNKLKGNTSNTAVNEMKNKINLQVNLIEEFAIDENCNINEFINKLNEFWGLSTNL